MKVCSNYQKFVLGGRFSFHCACHKGTKVLFFLTMKSVIAKFISTGVHCISRRSLIYILLMRVHTNKHFPFFVRVPSHFFYVKFCCLSCQLELWGNWRLEFLSVRGGTKRKFRARIAQSWSIPCAAIWSLGMYKKGSEILWFCMTEC